MLDRDQAKRAIVKYVADPLGMDLYEAAAGILDIVNNNMVGALKVVSVEKGYDPQYGARPMRRAVERYLEDPLAEEILRDIVHDGDPIEVSADDDKLTFSQIASVTETVSGQ